MSALIFAAGVMLGAAIAAAGRQWRRCRTPRTDRTIRTATVAGEVSERQIRDALLLAHPPTSLFPASASVDANNPLWLSRPPGVPP
jgi:hypothetical protein